MDINFIISIYTAVTTFIFIGLTYAIFRFLGISFKATYEDIKLYIRRKYKKTTFKEFFRELLETIFSLILSPLIIIFLCIFITAYVLFFSYKPFKSLKYSFLNEIKDPKYFFNKNFLLKFSNNFVWKTKNSVIILKKEYHKRNLYCYDNNNLLCVIREVDNILNNYDFLKAVYSNYNASEVFDYNKFIEYSNQMGMYIRTYNITNKLPEDEKFNIEKLLKFNDINLEFKKININTANLQEIINLPFINIVAAKKNSKSHKRIREF